MIDLPRTLAVLACALSALLMLRVGYVFARALTEVRR